MFINAGARDLLLQGERQKFLAEQWPRVHATIQRLGLTPQELLDAAAAGAPRRTRTRSAEAMPCIEARGLRKAFGTTVALDGVDLRVEEGRILGLIGPNGAGKTTALNAILGLTPYQGELKVLGRDPWTERDRLMRDVCFIADVAVLPRWMRVSQALDYVAGVHPRFDRAKAEGFLAKTAIKRTSRVRELSKGMVTQLHLALVMAIDAQPAGAGRADARPRHPLSQAVLRLAAERLLRPQPHHRRDDPPGRRDPARPHRPHVHRPRPHRARLQHGGVRVALPGGDGASRARSPRRGRSGRSTSARCSAAASCCSTASTAQQLAALGEVRTPSIADLFVAVIGNQAGAAQGAAR